MKTTFLYMLAFAISSPVIAEGWVVSGDHVAVQSEQGVTTLFVTKTMLGFTLPDLRGDCLKYKDELDHWSSAPSLMVNGQWIKMQKKCGFNVLALAPATAEGENFIVDAIQSNKDINIKRPSGVEESFKNIGFLRAISDVNEQGKAI